MSRNAGAIVAQNVRHASWHVWHESNKSPESEAASAVLLLPPSSVSLRVRCSRIVIAHNADHQVALSRSRRTVPLVQCRPREARRDGRAGPRQRGDTARRQAHCNRGRGCLKQVHPSSLLSSALSLLLRVHHRRRRRRRRHRAPRFSQTSPRARGQSLALLTAHPTLRLRRPLRRHPRRAAARGARGARKWPRR